MCHKVLEEDLIVRIDVILRVEGGVVWMEVGKGDWDRIWYEIERIWFRYVRV